MPTPNVSIVDLVVQVEKKTFAEEVNDAFRSAANGPMKGILAVSDEPLVSVDFRCSDVSTTIDSSLTMVMVRPPQQEAAYPPTFGHAAWLVVACMPPRLLGLFHCLGTLGDSAEPARFLRLGCSAAAECYLELLHTEPGQFVPCECALEC